MTVISNKHRITILIAATSTMAPASLLAQANGNPEIIVNGQNAPMDDAIVDAGDIKGPEIKGIISARSGNKLQITSEDGSNNVIDINDATRIKSSGGFLGLGGNKLAGNALLNGLPVTVKTMRSGNGLVASDIKLRNRDLKTANMIRTGTAQGFAEQTAATQALRGRMGDLDQYNIKGTTNVNFDTGKSSLSSQGKADLCATANAAKGIKNSLLLIVGYTDSTGGDELNQRLSEKRASRVVNYIQQNCGWKPYRMLTPAGMSKSDPLASNDTEQGKAQNRRVAVNILVSKAVDGL